MSADGPWHPWQSLPFPADGPGAGLEYPADADRFHVEELPLYEPCGEGSTSTWTSRSGSWTPRASRR